MVWEKQVKEEEEEGEEESWNLRTEKRSSRRTTLIRSMVAAKQKMRNKVVNR